MRSGGSGWASVLSVVYVIFTEGSTATSGNDLIRPDLAYEAVRLARVLARLVPDEPEVYGLLALLELTAARFPARTGPDGDPVLLADQDRRRWDLAAVRRGRAALARAGRVGRGLGAYGLQAAIAECHAVAPSVEDTDWERIVVLYEALGRLAPSPVVELNRAVALSMAQGPAAALRVVDDLVTSERLAGSHLLPSVRGELLTRLGRTEEARSELARAVQPLREQLASDPCSSASCAISGEDATDRSPVDTHRHRVVCRPCREHHCRRRPSSSPPRRPRRR